MSGNRKNFRTYEIGLTANQEYPLGVEGDMYAVIDNAGVFTITLDESNRLTKQTAGMGGKFAEPYQGIILLSTTTQTVTVIFGFGEFADARSSVNATINVTTAPSDTFDNAGDVTIGAAATLIRAADSDTKEVMVHIPSSAPSSVRIGGAGVTTTSGLEMEPGQSAVFSNEAALYGIRTGTTDIVISALKMTRP